MARHDPSNSPFKVVIFFGYAFAILIILSLLIPEGGIRITDDYQFKFISFKTLLKSKKQEYVDISKIIDQSDAVNDTSAQEETRIITQKLAQFPAPEESVDTIVKDTLIKPKPLAKYDLPVPENVKQVIEFGKGQEQLLFKFFKKLDDIKKDSNQVRILHYGDSQIESDRITSYIRNKLQTKFGGQGVGMLPIIQPYSQYTILQDASDNWNRYTIFGKKDTTITHKRYGALGGFSTFEPNEHEVETTAWFGASRSRRSYRRAKDFTRYRVFYGNAPSPFTVELYVNEQLYDADIFPARGNMGVMTWNFDQPPQDVVFRISAEASPEFYAFSLEGNSGVTMDNIPMRGSSGIIFSKMDLDLLQGMYEQLDVDMLIFEYGGNVVPYIGKNYKYYGNIFRSQLNLLQSMMPDIPIIVIGNADMSVKAEGELITHPNLVNVRNALKKASFEAGCAYWDMFEAMGGLNSMPSWVDAEPPLASTDYIHFTNRGARIIAEMFYNALLYEYDVYRKSIE